MNPNKKCPVCGAEYLPHIAKCADCGAVLLSAEEFERSQGEVERVRAHAFDHEVAVREGDLGWMRELEGMLVGAGIPCAVRADSSCVKSCRETYRVVVPPDYVGQAQERIEEYFMELHPELRESRELMNQGKCPACGSQVGTDDRACAVRADAHHRGRGIGDGES